MLVGGLKTTSPIDITIRPLACTATIMHDLMGADLSLAPRGIKGAMLSCILSDTLEFRSPTTTDADRQIAERLAADLGVDIPTLAAEMFEAKSDVSAFSDAELLRMDSKEYNVGGKELRAAKLMNAFGACIDHVLVTPELCVERVEVGPSIGSDHRPVIARLRLASPAEHAGKHAWTYRIDVK